MTIRCSYAYDGHRTKKLSLEIYPGSSFNDGEECKIDLVNEACALDGSNGQQHVEVEGMKKHVVR